MKKETSQKRYYFRTFSILILFVGVVLMVYMIRVEGEPGLLPLLLVIAGVGFLIVNQLKLKKLKR
tara:strand:+ start:1908 stop:2102 length:195 start_codon:yes stop_codon:yes gene_type:complete